MRKEWKICMPLYKLVYSVSFIVILPLVRGISGAEEIGITLQTAIGILAMIFCADTYECEYTGKRWEVFSLRPHKYQVRSVRRRVLIEMIYIYLLSLVGYGLFYWQGPRLEGNMSSIGLFIQYLPAAAVSVAFWCSISVVLSGILHSMIAGIGGSFILWLALNSTMGEAILGKWNVFAYSFRNTYNAADYSWICGAILALILAAAMIAALSWVVKMRRNHSRKGV